MGCAPSKAGEEQEDARRDADLQQKNKADFEKEANKIKLLLLGAGESGKSTIFKQMRILYGTGYSEEERRGFTQCIHANIITAAKALVDASRELPGCGVHSDAEAAASEVLRLSSEAAVDERVAGLLTQLWADPGIQMAFGLRSKFQLNDSAPYFMDRLKDISAPGYVPTVEDVLRSRVRTTGVVDETYVIDGTPFELYDVGGQRNERRKWIHLFDDVTAIIFVAGLSEYDQVMYEDSTCNRLQDALKLFEDVCNSRYFENTSIILFLNKRDLFAEKIAHTDLRQPNPNAFAAEAEPFLFADYTGGCDYDAAIKYVVGKFLACNRNPRKEVFWRVTCACDTENIQAVFNSVKEIILRSNLVSSGLA